MLTTSGILAQSKSIFQNILAIWTVLEAIESQKVLVTNGSSQGYGISFLSFILLFHTNDFVAHFEYRAPGMN
jgi:hypothetical protein